MKLVDELEARLSEELTADAQYRVHVGLLRRWGYNKLADSIDKIGDAEQEHFGELTARLYLLPDGGMATAKPKSELFGVKPEPTLNEVKFASTVEEVLQLNLEAELDAIKKYAKTVKMAVDEGDEGTAQVLRHILSEEEQHLLYFLSQLDQLRQMKTDNYLSTIV